MRLQILTKSRQLFATPLVNTIRDFLLPSCRELGQRAGALLGADLRGGPPRGPARAPRERASSLLPAPGPRRAVPARPRTPRTGGAPRYSDRAQQGPRHPPLLRHFVTEFNHRLGKQVEGVAGDVNHMLYYEWPGNVRELKNVIETCMLNLDSGPIGLVDIPEQSRSKLAGGATNEKELLLSALFSTKWNKSLAAQKLHWSRVTVYRKMAKYHLVPDCKA